MLKGRKKWLAVLLAAAFGALTAPKGEEALSGLIAALDVLDPQPVPLLDPSL